MTIRLAEPSLLEMKASEAEVVKKLQAEARRIFTGVAAPSVSSR
jgi:hypothetical protein